jgi:hypothetical protein
MVFALAVDGEDGALRMSSRIGFARSSSGWAFATDPAATLDAESIGAISAE